MPKAKTPSTSYVTVSLGNHRSVYTYKAQGDVKPGATVWVRTLNGIKSVEVLASSTQPPSKVPAPDGYTGRTKPVLR